MPRPLACTAAALFAVFAAPALAQNCASPQTQLDSNICAGLAYEAADAALNAEWPRAMTFARSIGQADNLRNAQRQWIAYRDAACGVQASPYQGGSIYPLIVSTCLTDLTNTRTLMLREFASY